MPIFHFYFTTETIFAREFWTKPFPSHPLSNYHLLFTSGILVIHTHWDMYMPFSFHLVRLWVALENISARGRKQGTGTEEEYTEKSWDVRISFVPLMFLSIWIIIIWIVGVPPNNEKIPGIFFSWRISQWYCRKDVQWAELFAQSECHLGEGYRQL